MIGRHRVLQSCHYAKNYYQVFKIGWIRNAASVFLLFFFPLL